MFLVSQRVELYVGSSQLCLLSFEETNSYEGRGVKNADL